MLTIDPNYRSLPEQVDFLTDENETNKTDISNLENDVENLDGRVTQNENDIDEIEGDIEDLQEDVSQHTEDISNLNSQVEAVAGKGGYLIPHNFETATPTEQQLNDYALSQITNITQPEEIFNGTRVTNLYNNHTWILNNTQDTDPVVFEWVDLGQSLVSIATNSTEGVVKGSGLPLKVAVAVDGTMSVNNLSQKLNQKQDTLNTTNIQSGTIDESIGFDNLGNVVRGSAGGRMYEHLISFERTYSDDISYIKFNTKSNTPLTIDDLKLILNNGGFTSINKTYPTMYNIKEAMGASISWSISQSIYLYNNTIKCKYITLGTSEYPADSGLWKLTKTSGSGDLDTSTFTDTVTPL